MPDYPLISHELPLDLIDERQDAFCDYMFVLLHKMIEDKEYCEKVYSYRNKGGIIYLDNSCFELGEALDNNLLYEYYEKCSPDILILPDTLGDYQKTINRTFEFIEAYPDTIINSMAVIQGSTPEEMIECYKRFTKFRDKNNRPFNMIGIPFVFSWIPRNSFLQANERVKLLSRMVNENIINHSFAHHLLGTWQAREFAYYTNYRWITSLDTSNPVMAAIDGVRYDDLGIMHKPISTFDTTYNMKSIDLDIELIYYNISQFRRIVNGVCR